MKTAPPIALLLSALVFSSVFHPAAAGTFTVNTRNDSVGTVAVGSTKTDTVTVTNTGTTTLSISSVKSTNSQFTLAPTSGSILAGASRKFRITFAPASAGLQTASIIFTHNGPSSPDTVRTSGTGSAPKFSNTRKTVAFGIVVIGDSRADSVSVANTGNGQLTISSVTSTNARFTVSPASGTIQPGSAGTFTITFRPTASGLQTGSILFTHNAPSHRDTVAVNGTGTAVLPPPVLATPGNGTTGQSVPVTLGWSTVSGASLYWLRMATDPQFAKIVISDSTLQVATRQVSGLPANTRYYWKVSTRNPAGFGLFSEPWTFSTVVSGAVAGTISFSGDVSSTSYRMFGLPGVGARKAGEILSGTATVDWRMLSDNGKDTTYPAYYSDLAADSVLTPGEGYWLLMRKDLSIARTDTLPPLGTDGTYPVPLHGGWNMITNPFTVGVTRQAVIAANGLSPGTLFWEHAGSVRTSDGTTLDPFKAYYFDNDSLNLAALRIPYPFTGAVAKSTAEVPYDWRAELVLDTGINTDRGNYIGVAPGLGQGRNALDQHEAPLVFDQGFLYFVRPAWDARHSRFATDIRPSLGGGQTWDFEVWNPHAGPGRITVLALDRVPASYSVALVDALNSSPVDMRRSNVYAYTTSSRTMEFKIIVGPDDYVKNEISKLIPRAFELAQNYPNPFNPSTTIRYMLPEASHVRLEILSVLGQRVRILDDGYRAAATYSVVWDGKDDNRMAVSTGVYFCRLSAGESVTRTRKLLLVK